MKTSLLIIALLAAPSVSNFEFCWFVAHEKDASIAVVRFEKTATTEKTPMLMAVDRGSGKVTLLSRARAESIGAALSKAEATFDELQKAGRDGTQKVTARDCTVLFDYAAGPGKASVRVVPNLVDETKKKRAFDEFSLTREQAAKFAPILSRSGTFIDKANRIIAPNGLPD